MRKYTFTLLVLFECLPAFAQTQIGSSPIHYLNGKVGIGLVSPTERLHVSGNVLANNEIKAKNSASGLTYSKLFSYPTYSGFDAIDIEGTQRIRFATIGHSFLNTGTNFGIGTNSPAWKFTVNSAVAAGSADSPFVISHNGSPRAYVNIDADGHGVFFLRNNAASNRIMLNSEGDSYFLNGNVGIGITNPTTSSP